MKRIYVASSWRNSHQPGVVDKLRSFGHSVYDFRTPAPGESGFSWSEIDRDWQNWTPGQYRAALDHPIARRGFGYDVSAMLWADTCVLVLPSGRSAHLEAGFMAGAGKSVIVYMPEQCEPELMNLLLGPIVLTLDELTRSLR